MSSGHKMGGGIPERRWLQNRKRVGGQGGEEGLTSGCDGGWAGVEHPHPRFAIRQGHKRALRRGSPGEGTTGETGSQNEEKF